MRKTNIYAPFVNPTQQDNLSLEKLILTKRLHI